MKAAPHVGNAGREPDPRACPQLDHRARLSSTARITAGSAAPSMLSSARPGNSIVTLPTDGNVGVSASFGASGSRAIVTGTKALPDFDLRGATRHVHTAASSETPGWRSRRWSERYWPRSRPAPASASQSSASLLPGETPAASAPAVQYHPCALSSAAAHDLSRWEHQTLTLPQRLPDANY